MRRVAMLALTIMAVVAAAMPQRAGAQDGSTAYNYLNITSSARIYGLGGVNITAVEDELSVTDQNPALLGPEMGNQVLVDYMHYLGGSNFAGARYARAVGERGAWSAGIRYFGYGKMDAIDEFGTVNGSFSPSDINFNGAFSYDITDRLRGGITMKFLYSSYEQ
ncbi:MAG: PorV/PorQ family protein, partial [Muribaculaceae bacterium]|nr:PorV/PorQ family protein [Muribaculaceae bacterium]